MLNGSDIRFLRWLSTYCDGYAEVGRVSVVVGRLARRGYVERKGNHVTLTDKGRGVLEAKKQEATMSLKQDVQTQMLRLLNGTCPTHGVVLLRLDVAEKGPIEACPRGDCGWQWRGNLPTLDDNVCEVAEKVMAGYRR